MEKLTPMMRQYLEIKEQYKDCILFFRLGDFYEMFFEDAEIASRELEITLTGRDCGLEERAPMCGVPFHSVNPYISKLINKGYKVAICEQMEDPALAKGIVKREVVRVITPGTVTELSMLDEKKNNFLLSVFSSKDLYGIAAVDITTGEFLTTRIIWGNTFSKLLDEIAKYSPSEIIVNTELFNDISKKNEIVARFNTYINRLDDEYFRLDNSIEKVNYYFDDKKIEELSVNACGALLSYLEQTQKVNLTHIREIKSYQIEEYMSLDVATRWHLELTETMRDKTRKGSLIWVMDKTVTSMGGRTLRKWLEQPLIKVADIEERLEAVSELKDKYMVRMEIREYLKKVYDIERLMSKVIIGNVNCRDLISLKESISQIPSIKSLLKNCTAQLNVKNYQGLHTLQDINVLIEKSIIDDPPVTVKEGGIIKAEYNEELAKLRQAATDGKKWIAELEALEKEKTGIKNLKVGFNKVFGYYIEVTKSYYSLVPDNYIRKQTLANCERYITQELKELEETILYAEEKSVELEYKIFTEIKDEIASHVGRIKTTASCLSEIDVICSLAELADRENYCMPEVDESGVIIIEEGRHPVVEKMMTSGSFVPNDTCLDNDENRIAIITGPNMAGKSTYMRQVALIVLMAQIGSFIPAKWARIGVVDKIFTRVGATDDLSAGQSTFMVEMTEVANILQNATKNSLVILDEVGRGTSTFDGLSIAWAVIEYISRKNIIGSRTLFSTHYHELTGLEGKIEGIKNYRVTVEKNGDEIIFLRKIVRGEADESYGIQVAKLAGLPNDVIDRAHEILKQLEEADLSKKELRQRKTRKPLEGQINIFEYDSFNKRYDELVNEIKNIDVSLLTPIEALNVLYKLQQRVLKGE